jgi:hypothetical protein
MKNFIVNLYNQYKDEIHSSVTDRIGYLNIYHNKWDLINIELLDKISSFLNIERHKILTINFLISKPNCKNQHYHIDYEGKTETFFIPLCELNDLNGTEIIEFHNTDDNLINFNKLLELSNTCYNKEELTQKLNDINITSNQYTVKYVNTNPFALIKIPYYLLHRGRTNETDMDRIMFSVVVSHSSDYILTSDKIVADAELDEHMDIKMNIIKNRNNNMEI